MNEKARREGMRWHLINTLNKARPYTSSEVFLLDVMRGIYPDATALELRQQLDYLKDRRLGVDIAEYTIDCEAGIARPPKYWES